MNVKINKIKKLLNYLKPYKLTLFIIFIIFLIQQICSLFLPSLMSDIVDIGIRQNGIENASPEAMSINIYDILTNFMDETERIYVNNAYVIVDRKTIHDHFKSQDSYSLIYKTNSATERYPLIKEENIYILKPSFYNSRDTLDKYFLKSSTRLTKYINHKKGSNDIIVNNEGNLSFNLTNLYKISSELNSLTFEQILDIDSYPENFDPHQSAAIINRQIYDELKMDTTTTQRNYILKVGIWMLIITVISMIFSIIQGYFSSKMSSGIMTKLRNDVFHKVESFSEKEFDKISASSLITRTTDDIYQMKDAIFTGIYITVPPIMFISGLIMAIQKSLSMSWTIILGALISASIIIAVFVKIFPKVDIMQKLLDKFNLIIRERLSGLMIISSLGNLTLEEKKFDKYNKELSNISAYVNRIIMYITPFLTVTMNLISILIIWLGANQISQSKMQVGDLMAFMQYSTMVISAFLMLVMIIASLPHAFISIDRVLEVLDIIPSIKDPENPKIFNKNFKGELCFKNVSFKYTENGNLVLNNISFSAKPGQIVSIVGATGSGKSTLASLIPRFYDVTSGEILIDGINIKHVKQSDLREKISYVPQKNILFSGDISYNLKYGNNNVNEKQLMECAEIANLHDIIKDDGLNRDVSQEGKNFSGGQRQRICIARAILKNTPIYIFDDSFSSLDFKTEAVIREKIAKYTKNSLVILISQRIGAVMNSDKIIVLDKGKIAGQGKHEELINKCKIYKEFVQSQISGKVIL